MAPAPGRGLVMFGHEFIRNAYLAGTFTALACGVTGWFVVLRAEVFAGDALSHVAFTGAVGAAALGLDGRIGLYAATVGLALVMGVLGPRAALDDATVGTIFAWILGLGILFTTLAASGTGIATANTLFGSIFGLSAGHARFAALVAGAVTLGVLGLGRPLLFTSLDPAVARAAGVRAGAVALAFTILLGALAGEATEAVGALLLLGLLAAPAGAARLLTADPWLGLAIAAALAVGSMWAGLALSYALGHVPPGPAVVLAATAAYLVAGAGARLRDRRGGVSARPPVDTL